MSVEEEYMDAYEVLVDVAAEIVAESPSGFAPPVGVTMEAMWRRPDVVPAIAAYFAEENERRTSAQ